MVAVPVVRVAARKGMVDCWVRGVLEILALQEIRMRCADLASRQ